MLVVTGASGFLGRAIVARAVMKGVAVTAVSRAPFAAVSPANAIEVRSYEDLLPPTPDSVLVHLAEEADIAKAEAAGADHLARMSGAFAALAAKGWSHVLYASSGAVYSDQSTVARREDDPVHPAGFYGRTKLACEDIAIGAGGVALRLGNVYGAGMPQGVVMSDVIAQIGQAGPMRLRDLSPARDFIHVDDVTDGFLAAAGQRLAGIYNVGTGVATSVGELARVALSIAGEAGRDVVETGAKSKRSSHIALDASRLVAASGWRATITLEKGLARLLGRAQ